jgi:hypothetical protein
LICLSFDTDHLDEPRMREFLAEVRIPGSGTFFCTQHYSSLEGAGHEICPHPVLGSPADWDSALDRARSDFPEARGMRPHSCVWSHRLGPAISRRGFTYVSTHDRLGEPTDPFREAWGIWQVPIFYMDNLDISFPLYWPDSSSGPFDRALLSRAVEDDRATFVFDFHPIHLLLNSASVSGYLQRREGFRSGAELAELRWDGYGAGSFFRELVELMDARGLTSHSIIEAVDQAKRS